MENIHRAKHGSDTGTYDHDGNFQRDSFEQIFQRYDKYVCVTRVGAEYSTSWIPLSPPQPQNQPTEEKRVA